MDDTNLPPLYANWIGQLLKGPLPTEKYSTCNDCAMCALPGEPVDTSAVFFSPKIKCCSYIPEMYNFLVGRVLLEEEPRNVPGRQSLIDRIDRKIAVSPVGLGRTAVYSLLYTHSTEAFGRAQSMRCPHYIEEGGMCGVWKHRNSICSTWFCKHERGSVGQDFWRAVQQLLGVIEERLSQWCLVQLGLSDDALRALYPLPLPQGPGDTGMRPDAKGLDNEVDEKKYATYWGNWLHREKEFYIACARLVNDLNWNEVVDICGAEVKLYIPLLQQAHQKMTDTTLPENLRPGKLQISSIGNGTVVVETYSNYNPLVISSELLNVLPYFDGSATSHVLKRIAFDNGPAIDDELLRTLVDHEILVVEGHKV